MNLPLSWPRSLGLATALVLALASPVSARTPHPIYDSAALLTPQPTSFARCPQFFARGTPPAAPPAPRRRDLCYEAFAVLHDGGSRTPVYVAQRLTRTSIEDADERRADRFFSDARLPAGERAELEDYKRSGYSRGHMAPAGDMPTPTAMAQSFSLANMVPQNIQHNGGPWAKIEQDTRQYVLRAKGEVYVITGPVFTACVFRSSWTAGSAPWSQSSTPRSDVGRSPAPSLRNSWDGRLDFGYRPKTVQTMWKVQTP